MGAHKIHVKGSVPRHKVTNRFTIIAWREWKIIGVRKGKG